jgi:peptide chain release factor 2
MHKYEFKKNLLDVKRKIDAIKSIYLKYPRVNRDVLLSEIDQASEDINNLNLLLNLMQDSTAIEECYISEFKKILALQKKLFYATIFNSHEDIKNSYLELNATAGGSDAQDWVTILQSMYVKLVKKLSFKSDIVNVDICNNNVRSVTMKVIGKYAYGWLKTENGVHRLVRVSPFSSQQKRHTSFASVYAYPEYDNSILIELNPGDLRIDTYRSSGAGGQKVNKTDSAVRVVHLPTGIKAECQNERSQHKNKEQALEQLKAKLYQLKKDEQEKELSDTRKAQIGFGDRHEKIRTYNFIQKRITDHRVPITIYRLEEFLDGNLDLIINSLLEIDKTNASK